MFRLFRLLTWGLLAIAVIFSLLQLVLRFWLLPNVENYREDIAVAITQAAGQRVAIGAISASWEGIRPNLVLRAVQVYDKKDTPALLLDRVDSTLARQVGLVAWRVRQSDDDHHCFPDAG